MGIISKGERPKIEEFLVDPLHTYKINQVGEGDLHDMIKEGDYWDYIESWFQEVTQPQYNSFIRHLLMQRQVSWLNFHIQVFIVTIF